MGGGIAQVLAVGGFDVHLSDIRRETLDAALDTIEGGRFGLSRAVERGRLSSEDAERALGRISGGVGAPPEDVDLLIEAVFEDLDVKLRLFRALDGQMPEHVIFASNTSGFPVGVLASATQRPDRFLVWHFASPVPVMALAELVVTPETSAGTIDAVTGVARAAGKNPVVIKDQPLAWGFVTNRVLAAATREADRIVAEGVATPEQVDQLLKDCFRWPAGLFEMLGSTSSNWDATSPVEPRELPEAHRAVTAFLFPAHVARSEARRAH
jgi:3-hydroxyacyl-CoA dehydrogenase